MRAIRTCLFAALAASVAACGGSDSKKDVDAMIIPPPDAPPDAAPDAFVPMFDFSCMGNAAPTTADANVTLAGFVGEVVANGVQPTIQAAHDATVDFCDASSTTCMGNDQLDTKHTPMNGCPQMGCPFTSDPLATGGTPLDLYLRVSKTGNLTTYIYPASPVTTNVSNIPAVMLSQGVITLLSLGGIVTQEQGKGILLVAITDCSNAPITEPLDGPVSVKQNGATVQGTTQIDLSQFGAELAGTYAIFNVPAGPDINNPAALTEVGATYDGKALRAHEVNVFRDSVTGTQVRPGY